MEWGWRVQTSRSPSSSPEQHLVLLGEDVSAVVATIDGSVVAAVAAAAVAAATSSTTTGIVVDIAAVVTMGLMMKIVVLMLVMVVMMMMMMVMGRHGTVEVDQVTHVVILLVRLRHLEHFFARFTQIVNPSIVATTSLLRRTNRHVTRSPAN